MSLLQKSKKKASSRQQMAIDGVSDGILILPGNHYRKILQTSSVNFELKSEEEQDALIDTYESFLNSIGSPLQIVIRTREIDMDKYLLELHERLNNESEDIYRAQLENYDEFIRSLITTNKILTRNFYVILSYNASPKIDFELVKEHLNLTADIVTKGVGRLGMQARELSSLEILDIFYSFYNPGQAKAQPLTNLALQLLHTSYVTKGVTE
jgi:hypothetical protein